MGRAPGGLGGRNESNYRMKGKGREKTRLVWNKSLEGFKAGTARRTKLNRSAGYRLPPRGTGSSERGRDGRWGSSAGRERGRGSDMRDSSRSLTGTREVPAGRGSSGSWNSSLAACAPRGTLEQDASPAWRQGTALLESGKQANNPPNFLPALSQKIIAQLVTSPQSPGSRRENQGLCARNEKELTQLRQN